MTKLTTKNSSYFVEWIPNNLKTTYCDVSERADLYSMGFLANNTAITQVFKRVKDQFSFRWRRRALAHQYIDEGMEEFDFTEAEDCMDELIHEYQQY